MALGDREDVLEKSWNCFSDRVNSQGTPKFRGLSQIQRNCKFYNWGITPNLEKWPFFNLVFGTERVIKICSNNSWASPAMRIIL